MLFFLFHIIYLNVLGPCVYLFFLFTEKSRNLIHNMQIIRISFISMWSTLPWFCIIFTYFYFAKEKPHDYMYLVLLYNIITIQLLKCSIIASKYSTLGHDKLQQFYSRRMSLEEINGEHMLFSWAKQTPV